MHISISERPINHQINLDSRQSLNAETPLKQLTCEPDQKKEKNQEKPNAKAVTFDIQQ